MTESKLDIALATVRDLADYVAAGRTADAGEARRTLNELCCQYADDLGCMSYPAPVRAALRKAGLSEVA